MAPIKKTDVSIAAPAQLRFISVQRREWNNVKGEIQELDLSVPWADSAAWAMVGIAGSSALALTALAIADRVPPWVWVVAWSLTIACAGLAVAFFLLARSDRKRVQNRASRLKRHMDEIEAECDQE